MKALVEPLPFVPAMWIGFRRLNSEGFDSCQQDELEGGKLGRRTPRIRACGTIQASPVLLACSCHARTFLLRLRLRSWFGGYSMPQRHPCAC